MIEIQLEEVMSGEDDLCLWVSLGYTSEANPHDVFHVVVAKDVDEQDRRLSMDAIYLEGDDQGKCCYGGADSISVLDDAVEVRLNDRGLEKLGFCESLRFLGLDTSKGGSVSKEIFKQMTEYECGAVISAQFQ